MVSIVCEVGDFSCVRLQVHTCAHNFSASTHKKNIIKYIYSDHFLPGKVLNFHRISCDHNSFVLVCCLNQKCPPCAQSLICWGCDSHLQFHAESVIRAVSTGSGSSNSPERNIYIFDDAQYSAAKSTGNMMSLFRQNSHIRVPRNVDIQVHTCAHIYPLTSNIGPTAVGNKCVDHSIVVEASPVGDALTTSSLLT